MPDCGITSISLVSKAECALADYKADLIGYYFGGTYTHGLVSDNPRSCIIRTFLIFLLLRLTVLYR